MGVVSGEEGGEGDARRGGGVGAVRNRRREMRRQWRGSGGGSWRGTAEEGDVGPLALAAGASGRSTEKE